MRSQYRIGNDQTWKLILPEPNNTPKPSLKMDGKEFLCQLVFSFQIFQSVNVPGSVAPFDDVSHKLEIAQRNCTAHKQIWILREYAVAPALTLPLIISLRTQIQSSHLRTSLENFLEPAIHTDTFPLSNNSRFLVDSPTSYMDYIGPSWIKVLITLHTFLHASNGTDCSSDKLGGSLKGSLETSLISFLHFLGFQFLLPEVSQWNGNITIF